VEVLWVPLDVEYSKP